MSVIVPLLGLAGEAGGLLSEYKKYLRDGAAHRLFKERVGEELGRYPVVRRQCGHEVRSGSR